MLRCNRPFMNNKLITHGVVTEHELTPNKPTKVTIDLQTIAYDLPEGHSLAIAIDTHDVLYQPPTRELYNLTIFHPTGRTPEDQSMLEIEHKVE